MSQTSNETQHNEVGLFQVSYRISSGLIGAPVFHVNLTVSTVTQKVGGIGTITQTRHRPVQLETNLSGNYFVLPILPPQEHSLSVHLTGLPFIPHPLNNVVPHPNVELYMRLDAHWQAGIATFSYFEDGTKITINDAKVQKVKFADVVPV
ncbi:DUF1842 domain-containing protein [Chitinophaga pendula]|uniref:DUF1842 domain-containing protein n=1 Tax=Chitinophaga TaxID=79328 RepID=UPI0012FDD6C6|nr:MULTISPECIES: DUF1842 domain-containing protein [Chitinophaga]UCJ06092.1 DUF1842 domain-containing protein [Chitinophaga pendula]